MWIEINCLHFIFYIKKKQTKNIFHILNKFIYILLSFRHSQPVSSNQTSGKSNSYYSGKPYTGWYLIVFVFFNYYYYYYYYLIIYLYNFLFLNHDRFF
jgi:hypothetical protein